MNTVILTAILSLILVWVFGSKDFAINITLAWFLFALLELGNIIISKKTISEKFWEWSEKQPRWKVWLVAGMIGAVGVYFTFHLALRI